LRKSWRKGGFWRRRFQDAIGNAVNPFYGRREYRGSSEVRSRRKCSAKKKGHRQSREKQRQSQGRSEKPPIVGHSTPVGIRREGADSPLVRGRQLAGTMSARTSSPQRLRGHLEKHMFSANATGEKGGTGDIPSAKTQKGAKSRKGRRHGGARVLCS